MIRSIAIRGFGPHESTRLEFDPAGTTEIAGPSESGKSTTLEAVCLTLFGTDIHGKPSHTGLVRNGYRRAEIAVELEDGRTLSRTRTAGGQMQRTLANGTGERTYTREEDWRAALGPLGVQAEPARLVMVPFAWEEPSRSRGGGIELRDILARILPEQDIGSVVARLMTDAGQPFHSDDPLAEDRAVELRRQRNAERDRAAGSKASLEQLAAAAEASRPAVVPEDAIAGATATQATSVAWRQYDVVLDRYRARTATWERDTQARKSWQARRSELGERPAGDDAGLRVARARQNAALDAHAEAGRKVSEAAGALRAAEANRDAIATRKADTEPEVVAFGAAMRAAQAEVAIWDRKVATLVAAGDTCPTCDRPGWESASAEVERARNVLAGKQAAVTDAEATLARASDVAQHRVFEAHKTAALEAQRLAAAKTEAEAVAVAARAEVDAAREAVEAERTAQAIPEAWDARLRTLGPEPAVGTEPGVPPTPPSVPRPSSEDVAAACDLLNRATRATGAAAQRERDQDETRSALATASEALDELTAECARLDALVEAVRRAPSIAASEQLGVMGDLGPVTIVFPREGAAIEIQFDSRPWWLASTGRQIVCDAWLRAGLRRALGMPWLPLWIDDVANVGGQELPALDGPVVLLRTTDDGPLVARTETQTTHLGS